MHLILDLSQRNANVVVMVDIHTNLDRYISGHLIGSPPLRVAARLHGRVFHFSRHW